METRPFPLDTLGTPGPRLPETGSWQTHISETLRLGIPLIGAQITQLAVGTVSILFVGRLGTADLAAIVLGYHYFLAIFIFGSGFASAVVPMAARTIQVGDRQGTARHVRMGLWLSLAFSAASLPLFQYSEAILVQLGQKPEVAGMASDYLKIAGWSLFPALSTMVLRAFLSTMLRTGIVFFAVTSVFLLNALATYSLVFGHLGAPALGIKAAALALLGVEGLGFCGLVLYLRLDPECSKYKLLANIWKMDWPSLNAILRLGLPIGFMMLAEDSLFTASSLVMGSIGTLELAAHGIAMQLAIVAFVVPLGLSQVATVRTGLAAADRDRDGIVKTAVSVIVVAASVSVLGGSLFVFLRETLAGFFIGPSATNAAELLSLAGQFILVAGIFQVFDGLQVVGAGLLRGLRDSAVPMVVAMVCYWGLGFGGALLLAFPLGLGGLGIWLGFLAGLASAAVLLNARFVFLLNRNYRTAL